MIAQVGGFDWNLIYHWHMVPKREMDRRQSRIDPIRSVYWKYVNKYSY